MLALISASPGQRPNSQGEGQNIGRFSVEIYASPGSLLNANLHPGHFSAKIPGQLSAEVNIDVLGQVVEGALHTVFRNMLPPDGFRLACVLVSHRKLQ